MSGEKVEEHNLISEVGMKSRLEDLGWVEWRSLETSVDVTWLRIVHQSEWDQAMVVVGWTGQS